MREIILPVMLLTQLSTFLSDDPHGSKCKWQGISIWYSFRYKGFYLDILAMEPQLLSDSLSLIHVLFILIEAHPVKNLMLHNNY